MFIPATIEERDALGWSALDIILVTGDAYIDCPSIGVALVGKILLDAGFRVGIVAQPDVNSGRDICRLGEPELFWGVTSGCVDSMVANYSATGRRRKTDDFTPGGQNTRRPDRAVIAYVNLIRRYFRNTRPIILGGIEASLRRIAHYDYRDDRVRRSILFDAKADYLLYGMADTSVREVADTLKAGGDCRNIRGLCYASRSRPEGDFVELPSYEDVQANPEAFRNMFRTFYEHTDPVTAHGVFQRQDSRYLVQNPPAFPLSESELDHVYGLPFEREAHPAYAAEGPIRALDTIRFSITTHRGCYGECNFCAIAAHQGRTVTSRSISSIVKEASAFRSHRRFKGIINDVGGPTANMYGIECRKKVSRGICRDKRCLFPDPCKSMPVNHRKHLHLLNQLRRLSGVRKVFVTSGIRYDMVVADGKQGDAWLSGIVEHHVSGQLKVAPEHSEDHVLRLMGKPKTDSLLVFKKKFDALTAACGKEQYLTYYFIAAHPGCHERDMRQLSRFIKKELAIQPEQVQVFTPTPSTWSTTMYVTGRSPDGSEPVFVERSVGGKEKQKAAIITNKAGLKTAVSGRRIAGRGAARGRRKR